MSTTTEGSLGFRMKQWEHEYRRTVPSPSYLLLRLDGRAFHSFTQGLNRPCDMDLMDAVDATMMALCEGIEGVRIGYCQSDEISLLLTNWVTGAEKLTEFAFGGNESKLLSLSASMATAAFNKQWRGHSSGKWAEFDSRLWTFPATDEGYWETCNYFLWRYRDCVKNSVTATAQAHFSHKQLHGVNTDQKLKMLEDIGAPWNARGGIPDRFRFGRRCVRHNRRSTVTYRDKRDGLSKTVLVDRTPFEVDICPELPGEWLYEFVPEPPSEL